MASLDKLALTSRLLYDARVLEQRREIEQLKLKLFFRDYRSIVMKQIVCNYNYWNVKCKCSGCKATERSERFIQGRDTEHATCLFGQWFDELLEKEGFVCLRMYRCDVIRDSENNIIPFPGLYAGDEDMNCRDFARNYEFSDADCHLVEAPLNVHGVADSDPNVRWGRILIGKRLWGAKSTLDNGVVKFKKVFGDDAMINYHPDFQ